MIRPAGFALLALGLACAPALHAHDPATGPTPGAIDAAVRATIERYQLPGIAVGVIDRGKVVYARGHGETVAGSGDPVTTTTLFKIASNSKAMTAAVLARLVQQGKLRWDDPVVKHLPQFAMHDPWVTQHMTVSDLLVHNSGLPEGGGDLMLWPEPNLFTRDDIVRGLKHIKPAYGFRSGYAYDNLLYVVAGQVAAAAGGAPYEELVRREVFAPLDNKDYSPFFGQMRSARPAVIYTSVAGNDTVRLFSQMAEFGISRNVQVVGASGTVTSQNLPAIGKAADGFVTGVGYATSIDSPENRKFVADFEAANKAAPDLYGADSYGVLFFYKAAVEKAGSTDTDKVRTAMRGLQWSTPQGTKTMRAGDHQAMQDMYAMRVNGGKFELVGQVKADAAIGPDVCNRF